MPINIAAAPANSAAVELANSATGLADFPAAAFGQRSNERKRLKRRATTAIACPTSPECMGASSGIAGRLSFRAVCELGSRIAHFQTDIPSTVMARSYYVSCTDSPAKTTGLSDNRFAGKAGTKRREDWRGNWHSSGTGPI
jgi:hypothetical protein